MLDPFNDGRSKLSFFYGRYYEAIPLNVASRYFGGEGILVAQQRAVQRLREPEPVQLERLGRMAELQHPAAVDAGQTHAADNAAGGSALFNNGQNYPVQSNLQGQYHNEIVATAEREVIEDMTVRLDYQHRWLGRIIEDGAADPSADVRARQPG